MSLKEIVIIYFNCICGSVAWDYVMSPEMDRDFLMFPVIFMGWWEIEENVADVLSTWKELPAVPSTANLSCADSRGRGSCYDYSLYASASFWNLMPRRKPTRSSEGYSSSRSLFLYVVPPLCTCTLLRVHLHHPTPLTQIPVGSAKEGFVWIWWLYQHSGADPGLQVEIEFWVWRL